MPDSTPVTFGQSNIKVSSFLKFQKMIESNLPQKVMPELATKQIRDKTP